MPVIAHNSIVLSAPLTGMNKGNLFMGRLRITLLRGHTSVTMRSVGSIPIRFPRNLKLIAVYRHRSPHSTFISGGCSDLSTLPTNDVIKASDLHHRYRLTRHHPSLVVHSLHNGINAHLDGLSGNRCSTVVLTMTKLGHLNLRSHVHTTLPPRVSLPTMKRNTINVRYHLSSAHAHRLLTTLGRRRATLHIATRHTVGAHLRNKYRIPVNDCTRLVSNRV